MSETSIRNVIGCDVGKDEIVLFDTATNTTQTVKNTQQTLTEALRAYDQKTFLVCEATGGYETALLTAATTLGLAIHRGDPRRINAFLRSLRSHGKTDHLDAQGLARYGQDRHQDLPLWQPPSKAHQELRHLVRLRADMVADRADYTRRLKAPGAGPHKRHISRLIASIERQIKAVDSDIATLIKADDRLHQTVRQIEAIKGCGPTTAVTLAALMPELGQLSRRQAASLAGLAPHPLQSGKADGYRRVRGGRREIRTSLFMAALTASRSNPNLRTFYLRLIDAGKKPLLAIVALARKLITIINAKIRDALYSPNAQLS